VTRYRVLCAGHKTRFYKGTDELLFALKLLGLSTSDVRSAAASADDWSEAGDWMTIVQWEAVND
jgi:hypothetical protein